MVKNARRLFLDIHSHSRLPATSSHPSDLLFNSNPSHLENRCVAARTSDAFAVDGKPWLRRLPASLVAVALTAILAALRTLDNGDDGPPPSASALRVLFQVAAPKMARSAVLDRLHQGRGRERGTRRVERIGRRFRVDCLLRTWKAV
jgi:hypothetical protein